MIVAYRQTEFGQLRSSKKIEQKTQAETNSSLRSQTLQQPHDNIELSLVLLQNVALRGTPCKIWQKNIFKLVLTSFIANIPGPKDLLRMKRGSRTATPWTFVSRESMNACLIQSVFAISITDAVSFIRCFLHKGTFGGGWWGCWTINYISAISASCISFHWSGSKRRYSCNLQIWARANIIIRYKSSFERMLLKLPRRQWKSTKQNVDKKRYF